MAAVIAVALSVSTSANAGAGDKADIIWVQKSQRQLHLITDYKITHSYPIALGKKPLGPKRVEGDLRTPEGLYYIDGRHENSDFYLSLHVSYPAPRDYWRAVRMNAAPGGHIMVHGEPNDRENRPSWRSATAYDWTDGCIALSNRDMRDLWNRVEVGVPVLIDA